MWRFTWRRTLESGSYPSFEDAAPRNRVCRASTVVPDNIVMFGSSSLDVLSSNRVPCVQTPLCLGLDDCHVEAFDVYQMVSESRLQLPSLMAFVERYHTSEAWSLQERRQESHEGYTVEASAVDPQMVKEAGGTKPC